MSLPQDKPKRGPPFKINDELISKLGGMLSKGVYIEQACMCLNISRETFYRWMELGKKARTQTLYRKLYDTVERAHGAFEANSIILIEKNGVGQDGQVLKDEHGVAYRDKNGSPVMFREATASDWRAVAWLLERKFPKRWGNKQTVEHTGADGGPIKTMTVPTLEEVEAMERRAESLKRAIKLTAKS